MKLNKLILGIAASTIAVATAHAYKELPQFRANHAFVQTVNGACIICKDVWTALNLASRGSFSCTTIYGQRVAARNGQTFFTRHMLNGTCVGPITRVTVSQ
jgi:hypothetical protein